MTLPLPFHSYQLRSKKAAQTRLLNCFPQQAPPEGRGPLVLNGIAGITPWANVVQGPQRAAIQFKERLYYVAGNTFARVDSSAGIESLGNVTSTGRVDIGKLTDQIAILIEPNLWIWDGSTLTQVADVDFTARGAKRMAVLDNYGGFIEPNSGRFFICDLNNFTLFDSLDFATAEGIPDNLLSIESNNRQFVLFGEESIELWDNVGGSGFPFLRVSNGFVENGCGAPYSTCTADNTVWWLDQDRIYRKLEGITPLRVSKEGCEEKWQDYSRVDDAYAFSYIHDGHVFIVLRFPTAGATWVYDLNTQEWHERQSYGYDHYRAAWAVKCYGKTLIGDTLSGNIGELSSSTYDEWGQVLYREATSGVVYDEGRWIHHDRLELDMDVGRGTVTGQGSDPEIMLDVSNDGGVTFRALANRNLGEMGQYKQRVHWDRLGRSRERVYRFRVSDPVPFTVSAARLEAR